MTGPIFDKGSQMRSQTVFSGKVVIATWFTISLISSISSQSFAQQIPEPAGWHYYADCHSDSYFGGWDVKIFTDNASGKITSSLERHAGPDGDGTVVPYTIAGGETLGVATEPRSVQFMIESRPRRYLSISHVYILDGFHRGVIDTVFPDGSKDAEQLLCTIR